MSTAITQSKWQRYGSMALLALCGMLAIHGCSEPVVSVLPPTVRPAKIAFSEIEELPTGQYITDFSIIDADGGMRHHLTHGVLTAPPGRAGAAVVQEDGIFLSPVAGPGPVGTERIASGSMQPNDPQRIDRFTVATSPDGTRATYTYFADRRTVISGTWGSDAVTLPRGVAPESTPQFSPDGLRLAFFSMDSTRADSPAGLYVINVNGTGLRLVDTCRGVMYSGQSSIEWSPSGDRLVLQSDNAHIRVAGVDGSGGRTIGYGTHPTWSPSGDNILYSGAAAGLDLYLIAADGSGTPWQITNTPGLVEFFPQFSPDGKQILYTASTSTAERATGDLIVMDLATAKTTTIALNNTFRGFWLK